MNVGGERLELEKAVPRYRRPGRSISVSAVPFGPGTDIWRSCRFLGSLFRGLRDLPLGLRRFVPCDIGSHQCRLRHIGWERCGHGLASRPRESASEDFLNRLLVLFGYPTCLEPREAQVSHTVGQLFFLLPFVPAPSNSSPSRVAQRFLSRPSPFPKTRLLTRGWTPV